MTRDDVDGGPWRADAPGVVLLPSGRRVRGRSLRADAHGAQDPTVVVHLGRRRPPTPGCERYWIRWVPTDVDEAVRVLREVHGRALRERVEIACRGGVGRTGTAIASVAVLEGMAPADAVAWVRARYHHRAVEVPWQRRVLRAAQQPRSR